MSYIIECMLCWECCRIYIRKRFEYARCGRVFFRSGGKNLRFEKYPDACGQNLRTRRSRGQRDYEAKRHVDPIHFTTCYIWEDRHDCCLKVKDYLRIDPYPFHWFIIRASKPYMNHEMYFSQIK